MAYFKNLASRCSDCPRLAAVAVFNNRNVHMGDYCNTCGKRRVEKLSREEREAAEAQRA